MKKALPIFSRVFRLTLLAFLAQSVFAQSTPFAEWMRVQSDDGEFSIEVPAQYAFIADKEGFSISTGADDLRLKDMSMLNAYSGGTLVSFEGYQANKRALDTIRESDARDGAKNSELRLNGRAVKQIVYKNDESYTVRRYIHLKNRIYILTAAARGGETPEMKRFFDSLVLDSTGSKNASKTAIPGAVFFSNLKIARIEVDQNPPPLPPAGTAPQTSPQPGDDQIKKLLIVNKPRAAYTNAARMNQVKGTVQVRLRFSENGFISKVGFLKTLPEGLTWQCLYAALRIKFLPEEKLGKPVATSKVVEYSFSIY